MGNQELPDRRGEGVKPSKRINKQDPGLREGGGGGPEKERKNKKKEGGLATTFFFSFSGPPPPPQGLPETKGQGTAKALKGPLRLLYAT